MRTAFDYLTVCEDTDEVRVTNRRNAVRDNDRCAARAYAAEIFEDRFLGLDSDRRERIV